ncbi:hypothetical protein GH714_009338 [Hevea brasiliensis]|uniref:FAR1 domain-containing protein n=1 Tax=Hevea brasiliensis TaxID=3981 RepID=A0A6A6KAS1_HEVBR|nr:hypothetical protein GH714_009338 [Hevea brasiliensis]
MALNVNVLNLQDYLLLKLKLEKVISLEDDEALKNMDVDNETPYVSRSEKDINALMNTVVCNEGEAYKLYNDYAIGVGFSIKRGTTRYHVGTRDISQKEYYCSSEGFSKEVKLCETRYHNRFETRTGCQAMVRFTIVDGM